MHDPALLRRTLAALSDAALLEQCREYIALSAVDSRDAWAVLSTREAWYACLDRGRGDIYRAALELVRAERRKWREMNRKACEEIRRKP